MNATYFAALVLAGAATVTLLPADDVLNGETGQTLNNCRLEQRPVGNPKEVLSWWHEYPAGSTTARIYVTLDPNTALLLDGDSMDWTNPPAIPEEAWSIVALRGYNNGANPVELQFQDRVGNALWPAAGDNSQWQELTTTGVYDSTMPAPGRAPIVTSAGSYGAGGQAMRFQVNIKGQSAYFVVADG